MIGDIILGSSPLRVARRALRWHLSYATGRRPTPLSCGFFITTRCNLRCDFCDSWRIHPEAQMDADDARELVRELGRMGLIYLAVGGGEPLLVPHLYEVLARAKEAGVLFTHLVSNGLLLNASRARELRRVGLSEISLSLDGDEAFHDHNRLEIGSFARIVEAIQHVRNHAPDTGIVLNTILDPLHPENALAAVEVAERLKVRVKVQPLNPRSSSGSTGQAANPQRTMEIDGRRRLLDAIETLQRSPWLGNSPAFLENYKAYLFRPDRMMHGDADCLLGLHHIEVFGDRVFPCLEGLDGEGGVSLGDRPLAQILTSAEYMALTRRLKRCSGCRDRYAVCYYEPRLNFPLWNYLRSRVYRCGPAFPLPK